MYIPRWKRHIIIKRFFIFLLISAIGVASYMIYIKSNRYDHNIHDMNSIEPHCSTGGPLIMYNTADDLIGFYIDELPIYHAICHIENIEHGIYTGIIEDDQILVFDDNDILHTTINVYTEEIKMIFDECTILVYDKSY